MRRRALLNNGEIDYSKRYLTFTALESGTFSLVVPSGITSSHIPGGVSYSIDNGSTWTTTAITSSAQTITTPTINAGGTVLWKAVANQLAMLATSNNHCKFQATCNFDVSGNIMSLEYGDNFVGQTVLKDYTYSMAYLFYKNTKVISAKNLILPATTLKNYCYYGMFNGCTSLTTAPSKLPATTLANYCYYGMFENCASLITTPILPATMVLTGCYGSMFRYCTSLISGPELPATSIIGSAYYHMFEGCTSLTTAPELPATRLYGSMSYAYMFCDCTSLITAPELQATLESGATYCYYYMFKGCTSLMTAPSKLPATMLTRFCYQNMFEGCTSLTTAPELPATTLAQSCYQEMFKNCTSLNYVKCLAQTMTATDCTKNWLNGVAASGTFVSTSSVYWERNTVNGIPSGWTSEGIRDSKYMTIISLADNNTIGWKTNSSNLLRTISISTDDGDTWTAYTSSANGTTLATLNNGDKILIKGSNSEYGSNKSYNFFTSTKEFDVEGNIMSLLYGDDFVSKFTCSSYAFEYLFARCNKLKNANSLILPSKSLTAYCYRSMFYNCTSLEKAPMMLPATSMTSYSCYYMFANCTSLVTVPKMKNASMYMYSCAYMFRNCTSLITAPALPSTTMHQGEYCYEGMFQGCTSLTTAPTLPATSLAHYCYEYMFKDCTALTTAPTLPATTMAISCYYGMFQGCTSLTTAPVLSATTLANYCYYNMFNGCTKLTTAPSLPATTLTDSCYYGMFQGCTSLTTAPVLLATKLLYNCYYQMFYNCSKLNYIKAMFTTTPNYNYTANWLSGVAKTGTFIKNSAATWTDTGTSAVPTGWTIQTASS